MARKTVQDIILEEQKQTREDIKEILTVVTTLKTTMEGVENQTTKTNGRVSSLEDKHDKLNSRFTFYRGGLYFAYIIIGAGLTLLAIYH